MPLRLPTDNGPDESPLNLINVGIEGTKKPIRLDSQVPGATN